MYLKHEKQTRVGENPESLLAFKVFIGLDSTQTNLSKAFLKFNFGAAKNFG